MSFWSDFNETRGNRPDHQKNDPEGQRTRSGPELRRNGRFYVRPKSGFWPKNGSYPKKSPKMTFSPLIIWAKATFFFEQLFPVVARTWLGEKSDRLFFGPKFRFLAKKSDFCHMTPIFVDDPFLALVMTVNFPPWKRFFDFSFRSYSSLVAGAWTERKKMYHGGSFLKLADDNMDIQNPEAQNRELSGFSEKVIFLPFPHEKTTF